MQRLLQNARASICRQGGTILLAIFAIQVPALADCPIPEGGSIFVRVERGHLIIDTSATNVVTVEVSDDSARIEEQCFDGHTEINGLVPEGIYGRRLDWRISLPRSANLDLLTLAGSIRISPTEGNVTARTTGGSVMTGNIDGNSTMITQGGSIIVGNIGRNAEMHSTGGGQIEIGNVGGNAELETIAGPITTGIVSGRVVAKTNGGTIDIREAKGELEATTLAGDIVIGISSFTRVRTAGGNISAEFVHGPFVGSTDLGNIRIGHAESYIEATAGIGDIEIRMAPVSLDGDLHVRLTNNSGNIHLEIPSNLSADVEAEIVRTGFQEPNIRANFPMEIVRPSPNFPTGFRNSFRTGTSLRQRAELNGGGNEIKLETSRGAIEIRQVRQ